MESKIIDIRPKLRARTENQTARILESIQRLNALMADLKERVHNVEYKIP